MHAAVEWPSIERRLHFGALTDIRVDSNACVDDSCCLICVRTRRLWRILPPFPTRFRPRQYIGRLSGRRQSDRPGNMLLLLARHVDLELSFGSSSNPPSPYCSEKRSLHLQLEKRTLLSSLDRSASCERWRFQGSTAHSHSERPVRAGRRWGFLSDRKYRYHPRTQADVADCWPCFCFSETRFHVSPFWTVCLVLRPCLELWFQLGDWFLVDGSIVATFTVKLVPAQLLWRTGESSFLHIQSRPSTHNGLKSGRSKGLLPIIDILFQTNDVRLSWTPPPPPPPNEPIH